MDSDRPPPPPAPPHRTTTSTGDLFICFTSRLHSSSSMKSILSPGRNIPREPPISLSTSLSRRLRTSRSIKGGASPAMFPTTGKKRAGSAGAGFENPEPSSPKVTCIGQVRVKSKKKQGKKLSLSRGHSSGDVSFRKLKLSDNGFSKNSSNYRLGGNSIGSNHENVPEQRHNQRWVHLPLTICEALRAFGSEFSCLFPCRSSCFSPAKEEKTTDGVNRRDPDSGSAPSSCVAVFTRWLVALHDGCGAGDIELVVGDDNNDDDKDEDRSFRASRRHVFEDLEIVNDRIERCKDESRVSICVPPKNALLLMRCRSDPLKMEALANRLWDSTIGENDDEDEEHEEFVDFEHQIQEKPVDLKESEGFNQEQSIENEEIIQENEEIIQEIEKQSLEINEEDDEFMFLGILFEEIAGQNHENDEEQGDEIKEAETGEGFEGERSEMMEESKERESRLILEREGLPECLLLMMCEPKLSMEVSKETWVCSKDFIRRQPSRKKPPAPPQVESKVSAPASNTTTIVAKCDNHVRASPAIQPGRSSCSLPAPRSMAEMLEQKLVNAVGYEPFVLTRCKSEPMRTAAAKLAPENCFWKNRKLEPLRRASFGVGAAGIGV